MIFRCLTALGCLLLAAPASAQEWETPSVSHKDVRPYMDGTELAKVVLPPPPADGSLTDQEDVAGVQRRQGVDDARWQVAEADARFIYDRFAEALGVPIKRDSTPALINLLNRAERQVSGPIFAAKKVYGRARPYQRLQLTRVCGKDTAPIPDPDVAKRTSYPSGHSAYGWTAALILARVAPEKAPALLQRAVDYGESRVICGVHFPSDITAGRVVAAAVVGHLDGLPEFQRDLDAARVEVAQALARK